MNEVQTRTSTNSKLRSVLRFLLLGILFFALAWITAVAAFTFSRRSDLIGELLLIPYYGLAIPGLIYRAVIAKPIGLDLLTTPEMIMDSIIYALVVIIASRALRRTGVQRVVRGIIAISAIVAACAAGWLLAH